jgi:hypothetical protein
MVNRYRSPKYRLWLNLWLHALLYRFLNFKLFIPALAITKIFKSFWDETFVVKKRNFLVATVYG